MSSERNNHSHESEKREVEYREQVTARVDASHHVSDDENTFDVDQENLPAGYFTSPFFIGTMTGIGLGLMAGVAGFGYAAPILAIINADIGPVGAH
jgi:hypothetical protein